MKKITACSVLILILFIQACGTDKKKAKNNSAPINNGALSQDSLQQKDKTALEAPTGIAAVDTAVIQSGPRVEQPYDTVNQYLYKGLMVYRDNVGEFVDCSSQRSYFVNDLTNELKAKYYSFELPPNGPLYVEVVGVYVSPGNKAPRKFQRQMNISHLNVMDRTVPFQCGGALTKLKSN